jgi:flavin-dependent dehydrogenase
MLVGAGGHFCPVARLLHPPGHSAADEGAVVAAQEIELPLGPGDACPVDGDVPELYFCPDLRGYGWCVRKGDYLNVGFGRLDLHGVPAAAHAFVEEVRRLGRVPRTWPSRWPGHAYRVYAWRTRRLHGERVLLAGDAAGLAYPASGEGILPAIVSGQLAARVIRAAEPRFTEALLAAYDGALATRFGTPVASSSALSHVPSSWLEWAARLTMGNPWFVRQVVLPRFLRTGRGTLPAAA